MKTAIRLSALAALALCLVACSHDSINPVDARVALQVTAGVATKASDALWNADAIGITVVSVSPAEVSSGMTTAYMNAKYSTESVSSTAVFNPASEDQTIYFDNEAAGVTFTAYGPYQESAVNALPGEDGILSFGTTVQLTADNTQSIDPAQEAIDFVFAEAVTASMGRPNVNFTFNHCMAKIIVKVVAGTGVDETDIRDTENSSYTLAGLVHEGTFNVTTGVASASDSGDSSAGWDLISGCPCESIDGGLAYTAIIFPQNPASLTFSAQTTAEEFSDIELPVPSVAGGDETDGFAAGHSYTYTVTL